jgi:hypothetical protein
MVFYQLGPKSLKKMFNEVETIATRNLDKWAGQKSVELKDVTANVSKGNTDNWLKLQLHNLHLVITKLGISKF